MPHITLEHSAGCGAGLDFAALLPALNRVIADAIGTDIDSCKARVVRRDCYQVGEALPGGEFVHLDLLVLDGRSERQKRATAEAVLAHLRVLFADDLDDLQLTVYVHDILRACYAKHPPGTLTPVTRMA